MIGRSGSSAGSTVAVASHASTAAFSAGTLRIMVSGPAFGDALCSSSSCCSHFGSRLLFLTFGSFDGLLFG